jgi:chromosome segregation ATPase
MTLTFAVEIALTVLLTATLVYCAILERRLASLRKDQDGFRGTIAELNIAITAAGTSMRLLKSSAASAAETLDERLQRARHLIDELLLLTTSGERIAERIEKGASSQSERAKSSATPSILADRLEALRPQRADGARPAAMGHVR